MFFIIAATVVADVLEYGYTTLYWKPGPDDPMLLLAGLVGLMGSFIVFVALALVWLAWLIGLLGAWRGRTPRIPLLSRLANHTGRLRFSLGWSLLARIGLALLVFAAVHGAALTRAPAQSPQGYILYTNGGYIPVPTFSWA